MCYQTITEQVTYVDPEDMVEVGLPQVAPTAPTMETNLDVEKECQDRGPHNQKLSF